MPNTCLRFESLDGLVEFTQPSGITDGDGYVYTEIFGRPHLEEFAVTMNLFEPWNADLGVPPEIPQTPREMALVPIRDSIFDYDPGEAYSWSEEYPFAHPFLIICFTMVIYNTT